MGCCLSLGRNDQSQLAASIDFDYDGGSGDISQKSISSDLGKPMSDWHKGQVLYWLDNNNKKELKKLKPFFHQHQISGLTLVRITKNELKNELNINEDALCDLFLNERNEYIENNQNQKLFAKPTSSSTIQSRHESNITMDDIDISISRNSNSNDMEIKYQERKEIEDKEIDVTKLFNLLQQFNINTIKMKIIDLRNNKLFKQKHINTSININYSDKYLKHKTETGNDNILDLNDILIIDTNCKVQFLKHLQSFKSQTILIIIFDKNDKQNIKYKQNIQNYLFYTFSVNQYISLKDDFIKFYNKYPFLCNNNDNNNDTKNNKYPTEVIENKLYIGDWKQSENFLIISNLQITHILNVCHKKHDLIKIKINIEYKDILLNDDINENILNNGHLNDAINWIDSCLINDDNNKNNRIFIHCLEGVSQSATIVLGYLMHKNKWTFIEAQKYLKDIRPNICPNSGFKKQLEKFEKTLNL